MVVRRRLIFWLAKAYIKKWWKLFVLFFIAGIVAFFLLRSTIPLLLAKLPTGQREVIGTVGAYSLSNLPPWVLSNISRGLTRIDSSGISQPDLASSWEVKNNGKTYVFKLRKNLFFSDGTLFDSSKVNYNFSDVTVERPNKETVVFHLKDSYAPFLVTVSRPIFKNGIIGIGEYKIRDIKINGSFIESLTLSSVANSFKIKTYHFYPSNDALKTAYILGELTDAIGLPDVSFKNTSFASFPTTKIIKNVDYSTLVTVFFNTKDSVLSDKKIREALSYAVADDFPYGQRSLSCYPPNGWAYSDIVESRKQDITHAKLLLQGTSLEKKSSTKITVDVLEKYRTLADDLARDWRKLGVESNIVIVSSIPQNFQIYIGDFNVPKDPDQYSLWHSNQDNNITHYENQRIDKLLEDGRKTMNQEDRKKIYYDFQKYLIPDAPAAFLYFPYNYSLSRK